MSNEEVLDLPEFLERVQDDKELLLELLDIFLEDYQGKRQQLTEALAGKNAEEVRNVAHSLKGASGNISAKPLRAVLVQIEEGAKKGDISGVPALLPELDKQFSRLVERIAVVRKELA